MGGRGASNILVGEEGDDTAVYELGIESYLGGDVGFGFSVLLCVPDFIQRPQNTVGRDLLSGIEQLRFADGTVHLEDGSVEFDTFHYMRENLDVFHAGANALQHFNTFGWREGRDPSQFFDTSGYLALNKDVAAADVNPLDHIRADGGKAAIRDCGSTPSSIS